MSLIAIYLGLGLASGFVAGLLGVGGGLVLVPALLWLFVAQGVDAAWPMHLALGTSLAVIVFTALSSLRAHHAHGGVRWPIVARMAPGVVLGTLAGALLAPNLPDGVLRGFFACFLVLVATQMAFGLAPHSQRPLPGRLSLASAGAGIGLVSSWVGIAGGTMTVPFLAWRGVRLPEAIGTSAAVGMPIALAGAAGYALAGLGKPGLPAHTLGFIHWPAVLAIAPATLLSAPWGARMAHSLPVHLLKRLFAVVLYLVGLRMAWGVFG